MTQMSVSNWVPLAHLPGRRPDPRCLGTPGWLRTSIREWVQDHLDPLQTGDPDGSGAFLATRHPVLTQEQFTLGLLVDDALLLEAVDYCLWRLDLRLESAWARAQYLGQLLDGAKTPFQVYLNGHPATLVARPPITPAAEPLADSPKPIAG